jgi:hypothetical protein
MAKKVLKVTSPCHICGKYSIYYFDYKFWCLKCGKDPLTEFNNDRKNKKELTEEELNNQF